MCNPSSADATSEDPTVRKTIGFSARWGYQGITVINPWDLVLTYPEQLPYAAEPASPRNEEIVLAVVRDFSLLIVAWGCEAAVKKMQKRGFSPHTLLREIRTANPYLQIQCLGRGKNGTPKHPLMLAYSTPREDYNL